MDPVRCCPDHGFVAGDCPACGRDGEFVLAAERRERLSRFLSGALRHFPDDVGLPLDDAGWTDWPSLVAAATRKYDWADEAAVEGVAATDPKGRFERRDGRVRAVYGHSVDVTVEDQSGGPGGDGPSGGSPDRLYHGTAPENVDAVEREGLRPMNRQEVHLSETVAEARAVGKRHAVSPVVLAVDAAAMRADGRRLSKRGEATWTTDRVPPAYLRRLDDE